MQISNARGADAAETTPIPGTIMIVPMVIANRSPLKVGEPVRVNRPVDPR